MPERALEGLTVIEHNRIGAAAYASKLMADLGAEVIRTSSRDIASKLVEIARERQVTQLVLGQPARSYWEEMLRGSIINRVLRMSSDIDIHIVPRSKDEPER